MRGKTLNIFGIELIKIYLIGSNVHVFEHSNTMLYHSTLVEGEGVGGGTMELMDCVLKWNRYNALVWRTLDF